MDFRNKYSEIILKDDKLSKLTLTDNVKYFIQIWDSIFPIDYWWRKQYNIPFNSTRHREMSFIDMKIQHEEDKMIKRATYIKKYPDEEMFKQKKLENISKSEIDEIDQIYDDINIQDLNKNRQ